MKKYIFAFLLSMLAIAVQAQQLAVTSFERIERDMDARVNHPLRDHNGKLCAIIKVENTNTGFDFSTGTLQVQKVDQQPGEIWVYVQPGVRKMTVRHPQLGVLRDYPFPCSIDEATVYVMKLQSGTVETSIKQPKQSIGFLIIESEPSDAQVWLDNEWIGNTPFSKKYPIGKKFSYRIKKDLYHDEIGNVVVGQVQTKIDAKLLPAFGSLTVTTQPSGAYVYIDRSSQTVGKTPLTIPQLASGKHTVMAQMPKYTPKEIDVIVEDGQESTANILLSSRFVEINVNSLPDARIEINGKFVGFGSVKSYEEEGICEIKATKSGYRDAVKYVTLESGNEQNITLTPTPICGSLSVESKPFGAEIYIDDEKIGTTPNIISEVTVGRHTLKLKKNGYKDYVKIIEVVENDEVAIDGTLEKDEVYSKKDNVDAHKEQTLQKVNEMSQSVVKNPYVDQNSEKYPLDLEKVTFTVNGVSFNMIEVKGGSFYMGATPEQGGDTDKDEKPVHRVKVGDFLIGETEVTQDLWEAVMGNNPSKYKTGENLPVENVSWDDCLEFCDKLSALVGKKFRLPTEPEWEFAARGGNKSRGYKYSGSNNLDYVGWYTRNSYDKTHSVATKAPNELGIYDMSGNVWEWCNDSYEKYKEEVDEELDDEEDKIVSVYSTRVLRGGCWGIENNSCRISFRNNLTSGKHSFFLGFRLACEP